MHHCDNKKCVRPDHLYLGTQKENIRDIKERFDGVHISKSGEHHPRFGKHLSEEHKRKLSESNRKSAAIRRKDPLRDFRLKGESDEQLISRLAIQFKRDEEWARTLVSNRYRLAAEKEVVS